MGALQDIAMNWGAAAAVIAFFLWRDWQRELNMAERINASEEFVKRVLIQMAETNRETLANNTAALRQHAECVEALRLHCAEKLNHGPV